MTIPLTVGSQLATFGKTNAAAAPSARFSDGDTISVTLATLATPFDSACGATFYAEIVRD